MKHIRSFSTKRFFTRHEEEYSFLRQKAFFPNNERTETKEIISIHFFLAYVKLGVIIYSRLFPFIFTELQPWRV